MIGTSVRVETTSDLVEYECDRGCANTSRPLTHSLDLTKEGLVMQATRIQHFWNQVDTTGACWLWRGYVDANGYGHVGARKPNRPTPSQTKMVHRIAYELLVGPIPDGMHLDHLCRVTNCVNPDHLEPVTVRENVRRGIHGVLTTHCSEGHELSGSNVYVRPSDNSRRCVTCRNRYERDRRRGDDVLNAKLRKPCRRCGAEKSPGRYKHLCDSCIEATGVTKWHRLGR